MHSLQNIVCNSIAQVFIKSTFEWCSPSDAVIYWVIHPPANLTAWVFFYFVIFACFVFLAARLNLCK